MLPFLQARCPSGRVVATLILGSLLTTLAAAQTVTVWDDEALDVKPPAGLTDVVQISAYGGIALALRADGTVVAWGAFPKVNTVPAGLRNVTQVAAGWGYAMALKADGTVVTWGDVGSYVYPPAGLQNVVKIAASWSHCMALRSDGQVICWGDNELGALDVPAGLKDVVGIAAGTDLSAALRSDGTVVRWGLFPEDPSLAVPEGLTDVVQIASHSWDIIALKSDGTLVTWGWDLPMSTFATGLSDITQVAMGEGFALALRSDGRVVAWNRQKSWQPSVPGGLTNVVQVAAGDFGMAIREPLRVQLDQTAVYAGEVATGSVTLANPAGASGLQVALISSDPSVQVPASVRVAPGQYAATFPVTTSLFFGPVRTVNVGGSLNSARPKPFRLEVVGQTASLAPNTPSFVGGSTTKPQLTVTLGWTSWVDTVLSLASSDPSVRLPASITIPAGQTSAKVEAVHVPVPSDRSVSLSTAYDGETVASASVSVRAVTGRIEMASPRVDAGASVAGVVRLDSVAKAATTVTLKSDHSSLVVPSSVTVPAGAREASFTAVAKETAGNKTVSLTGSVGGNPILGAVRTVARAEVVAVEMSTFLVGCSRTAGRVRLKAASPEGGISINLASSDPSVKVPSKVVIPAGAYSAEFEATSADVPSLATATVTASVGTSSATDAIEVRPLAVSSLAMPSSTKGGTTVTATVTLTANVSVSRTVTLTVNDKALATVPASVLVPAGARSVSFTITTKSTSSQKTLTVSARKNESNVAKTLKINP